ncbi:MAG: ATP-binding protein [Anaerolineae bacterium]
MSLPMRWRIAGPFALVLLVTLVALGVYVSGRVRDARLRDYESQLRAEAGLLGELGATSLQAGAATQESVGRWSVTLGARVTLIAADGVVVADSQSDPETMENHAGRPEVQQALATGTGSAVRYSDTVGYDMLYVAVRPAGARPVAIVRLAVPLRQVDADIAQIQRSALAAAVAALLVMLAASYVVADRITRPLRTLTAEVQSLAAAGAPGDLSATGYDEVHRLAAAFSALATDLQAKADGLAEERNKMALVLAHLADGVVITDADGRVLLLNAAARRLLDLAPEPKAEGRPLAEVADGSVLVAWQRCREGGAEREIMVEMPERGAFLRAVCTPIAGARNSGEVLVLQDLSQVRRLETVRRDFISNISHELRTPLASLKALVETLQDGALEDPEAAPGFLRAMEVELDSLAQMVQELLELSRIESGQVPVRVANVAAAEVVRESVGRLAPQAERAGLTLAVDLPPDDVRVLADVERMRQVVTNIVHNAIKFTPSGGRVMVRAVTRGSEVVFSVSDTGPGIPAADMPRIFERFYKADRARATGGTGLGLAIAKHIVQAHGGRIWAESRVGQGSTFYFTLPMAR